MTKFVVYKSKDGWRWKLEARNGNTIAESGEAYKRRPTEAMLTKLGTKFATARLEIRRG